MNGLEGRVKGTEEGMERSRKSVEGLEKKEEEGCLRQTLMIRECAQARNLATGEAEVRMARVEARLREQEYRMTTTEILIRWDDQKFQNLWNILSAPNPVEAGIRSEALRQSWTSAAEYYNRRLAALPYAVPQPAQSAPDSTSQPALPITVKKKPPSF